MGEREEMSDYIIYILVAVVIVAIATCIIRLIKLEPKCPECRQPVHYNREAELRNAWFDGLPSDDGTCWHRVFHKNCAIAYLCRYEGMNKIAVTRKWRKVYPELFR